MSGINIADLTVSESIVATVPLLLTKVSTCITFDTPKVMCTNKLITGMSDFFLMKSAFKAVGRVIQGDSVRLMILHNTD